MGIARVNIIREYIPIQEKLNGNELMQQLLVVSTCFASPSLVL